jgi:putative phosphoribosyl transferase
VDRGWNAACFSSRHMLGHRIHLEEQPRPPRFADRRQAGGRLASKLTHYRALHEAIVLALPRGAVSVGFEVARALDLPLDVFLLRKLCLPGYDHVAMGTLSSGGVRILDPDILARHEVTSLSIRCEAARVGAELTQKELAYRGYLPPLVVEDQIVLLVDDGITAPSTMEAALLSLRQLGARRIVAAVPVGAVDSCEVMKREADEVVWTAPPEHFVSVGRWYSNHTQVTDGEIQELLRAAHTH